MSMEKRILIAFVLSAVIFAIWSVIFPPPKPIHPKVATTVPTPAVHDEAEAEPQESTVAPNSEVTLVATGGEEARVVALSNDVMEVRLNSQGALIEHMVLTQYLDAERKALDLIQNVEHEARTFPLQLVADGKLDTRVYEVEEQPNSVVFRWADGSGRAIVKTIGMPIQGYGLDISIVTTGFEENLRLSLGTGMRNIGPDEMAGNYAKWGDATISTPEDKENYRRKKLKEDHSFEGPDIQYVGFEDTYFLSVFRVESGVEGVEIKKLTLPEVNEKGENVEVPVLRIDLKSNSGVIRGQLFAAPKEYDLLQREGGGLEETLNFGFLNPIVVFFLKILRWIHQNVVGNWGWSIVLLTIGLRMALFPLMHTSTVSMRRMQKIQPKVKAIQEKYKKNKSDPQIRQKMNQETMALYKEEGVNPVGGCLPMLVQMPILFALYKLFPLAIEMRQAPFILWITDLSLKDPLYITPVLMTATMWLQQRLAPQAGDPNQMKMMRMMPLVFGIMFLKFPAALVLYWLTNNVVSILQQEVTLHLVGERKRPGIIRRLAKGKK